MRWKGILVVMSALIATTPVRAATVVCSGTIDFLAFHANDVLLIQLSSMNMAVQYNGWANWTSANIRYFHY